MKVRENSV